MTDKNMGSIDPITNGWIDYPTQTESLNMELFREERMRFGVSHLDAWNFDTFIAQVIANGCLWLKVHGVGYPGDMELEEWHDYLDSIREPLVIWAQDKFADGTDYVEEYNTRYANAKEAMHKFAERFGNFWD